MNVENRLLSTSCSEAVPIRDLLTVCARITGQTKTILMNALEHIASFNDNRISLDDTSATKDISSNQSIGIARQKIYRQTGILWNDGYDEHSFRQWLRTSFDKLINKIDVYNSKCITFYLEWY